MTNRPFCWSTAHGSKVRSLQDGQHVYMREHSRVGGYLQQLSFGHGEGEIIVEPQRIKEIANPSRAAFFGDGESVAEATNPCEHLSKHGFPRESWRRLPRRAEGATLAVVSGAPPSTMCRRRADPKNQSTAGYLERLATYLARHALRGSVLLRCECETTRRYH